MPNDYRSGDGGGDVCALRLNGIPLIRDFDLTQPLHLRRIPLSQHMPIILEIHSACRLSYLPDYPNVLHGWTAARGGWDGGDGWSYIPPGIATVTGI